MINENNKGYGVINTPIKLRNYDYNVCASKNIKECPDKYTIPEENIPDVHDQKWTNMCVAYTLCECAEAKRKQEGNKIHYSEAWTYSRHENRGNYTGEGMYAEIALKGSLNLGFLDKRYFDFMIDVPEIISIAKNRDDLKKLSIFKPKAYYDINYAMSDKKWDSLKLALVNTELPIVLVSHTFFKGGSHCILGIGYSDEYKGKKRRCVEFQNSWGKEYGDNGRSFIPFDKIDEIYTISWDKPFIPFVDVKESDWFYDDVCSAYLAGYIKGITNTEFYPNENMIRGDIAIILSRLIEKIEYSINSFIKSKQQAGDNASLIKYKTSKDCQQDFSDVDKDDYYSDAIYNVCANQLMNGKHDKIFDPIASTTRAEMATILVRVFEDVIKRLEVSFNKKLYIGLDQINDFSDVDKDVWYYEYVRSIQKYGLMNGTSNKTFEPDRNITRAEGAATMCRLFKKIENLFDQI